MPDVSNATFAQLPVIRTMHLVPGEERALAQIALRDRLDFLCIPECPPESAQRFDRLDLPTLASGAYQYWCRTTGASLKDGGEQWTVGNGAWIDSFAVTIQSLLRIAKFTSTSDASYVCLQQGSDSAYAQLRWNSETRCGEVTAAPLRLEQVHAITDNVSKSMDSVWVPCAQEAVNACMAEQGFIPQKTRQTLLLTPMLSRSERPPFEAPFKLSGTEVERYGHDSGDLNPLHFDDAFAQLHGFKGRISHGMLFNAWITRYLGMEYPGPGTIFLKQASSYFSPIYPDHEYTARVTVPLLDAGRGVLRVLVQLRDHDGVLVQLSYNDVMHRQIRA